MSRVCITCSWDQVPHLSKEQKDALWASIPPYQRAARSKGTPQLGAGAIYPIEEDDITCDPFDIPQHFRKAYGLDVGWNRTAALWGALDSDTDILYLYSEYYRGEAEPSAHAAAINIHGRWVPGVIDPASRGRSQHDGETLFQKYADLGLQITKADNAVEAGLFEVWQRMVTGRLKIFKTLRNTLTEFRIYRRDEKGRIVKENDHLIDALRYLCMSGVAVASLPPVAEWSRVREMTHHSYDYDPSSWGT